MADDILVQLVYPSSTSELLAPIHLEPKAIRVISDKLTRMPDKLTLFAPPKEDLRGLGLRSSPMRFVRADIAQHFLTQRPERGDAKVFQAATEKDASLGELVVLVDLFSDWVERAFVASLVELTGLTGRIERTVDSLKGDHTALGDLSCFRIADVEREEMDREAAVLRQRVGKHLDTATAQARRIKEDAQRAISAQRLKNADPERILQTPMTVKQKDKAPKGGDS